MATAETETVQQIREEYKYGFSNPDEAKDYFFKSGRGISHEVVEAIAEHKNEPDWMRKFRVGCANSIVATGRRLQR